MQTMSGTAPGVEPRPVQLTPRGLQVEGSDLPLMSGAVHYWRLDPARWEFILDQVAGLGYRIVETYVAWSVHEQADGSFDFGARDPRLNLEHFLRLVHARGMFALVRPGPHINSELTDFGFPSRVMARSDLAMRTAAGHVAWFPGFPRPFPIPSYASDAFYQEVEGWFDQVLPILRRQVYPEGPVVAVQVDNELSNFFRTGLYDVDYHPDAIRHYRNYVLERYGSLEGIWSAYGQNFSALDGLQPPRVYRGSSPLPWHLDWARFQAELFLMAYRRVKSLLLKHLPASIPYFTNMPLRANDYPFDLGKIEQVVDQVGLDLYYTRREIVSVAEAGRIANARTRLPSCPEFGAGCFLTWTPTTPDDNIQTALAATMFGIRSFNFYMLVDRERWYGSPVRTDGTRREPLASFYLRLNQLFEQHRLIERPRRPPVVIVRQQSLDRLMSVGYLLQPISPLILAGTRQRFSHYCRGEGVFSSLIPYEQRIEEAGLACQRLGLDYDLGEAEQDPALLSRYPVIIAPTFKSLEQDALDALLMQAHAGARVVFGPEWPELDMATGTALKPPSGHEQLPWRDGPPAMRGEGFAAWNVGQGQILFVDAQGAETLEPVLQFLLEDLSLSTSGVSAVAAEPGSVVGVRLASFVPGLEAMSDAEALPVRSEGEALPELIWVMNPRETPVQVRIESQNPLRDWFSAVELLPEPGTGVIARLDAYEVRVFEVVKPSDGATHSPLDPLPQALQGSATHDQKRG